MQTYEIRDHSYGYSVHEVAECAGRHEASTNENPGLSGTSEPPAENKQTKNGYRYQGHQLCRGFT